ncbi:translation initiation factor IF-2-like [Panicum virgatum]|uniref:Uncharacterized protein n=1 Tax=Panicum virgatum TaxID=38727 RepID=A0A8T0PGR0_PANVG|nr:translation initiation factor IF-2-like [Panicum virgatum]KAG2559819.1 hypothetical protein PVAP13_8KG014900 [Panicum virgatum]
MQRGEGGGGRARAVSWPAPAPRPLGCVDGDDGRRGQDGAGDAATPTSSIFISVRGGEACGRCAVAPGGVRRDAWPSRLRRDGRAGCGATGAARPATAGRTGCSGEAGDGWVSERRCAAPIGWGARPLAQLLDDGHDKSKTAGAPPSTSTRCDLLLFGAPWPPSAAIPHAGAPPSPAAEPDVGPWSCGGRIPRAAVHLFLPTSPRPSSLLPPCSAASRARLLSGLAVAGDPLGTAACVAVGFQLGPMLTTAVHPTPRGPPSAIGIQLAPVLAAPPLPCSLGCHGGRERAAATGTSSSADPGRHDAEGRERSLGSSRIPMADGGPRGGARPSAAPGRGEARQAHGVGGSSNARERPTAGRKQSDVQHRSVADRSHGGPLVDKKKSISLCLFSCRDRDSDIYK